VSIEMTGKQLMDTAMGLGEPERIPVHCQLSIGHILLNTGTSHLDFNFDSRAYAEALLEIREFYRFDGILLHKPGRDPGWQERCSEVITSEPVGGPDAEVADGHDLRDHTIIWRDGGKTELPYYDDPKYHPPKGFRLPAIDKVDPEHPFEGIPESQYHFWIYKAMFGWDKPDAFPDFYHEAIDICKERAGNGCHIHGEVKAPSDAVLNLLGLENGLMAFLTQPELVHPLMEYFTKRLAAWAVAQARRGCDAIKISSPYAGKGFLSRQMYEEFVVPYEREIAQAVNKEGAFVYTHTCGSIGDRLDLMVQSEISGIECLDPPPLGDVELEDAKVLLQGRIFIKGNLDSVNVLLRGTPEQVAEQTQRCLKVGSRGGGYILSTACSVAPGVPPDHIHLMVEQARSFDPTDTS